MPRSSSANRSRINSCQHGPGRAPLSAAYSPRPAVPDRAARGQAARTSRAPALLRAQRELTELAARRARDGWQDEWCGRRLPYGRAAIRAESPRAFPRARSNASPGCGQLPREPRADQRQLSARYTVKFPKPLVDSVDLHAIRAAAAVLVRHHAGERNQRAAVANPNQPPVARGKNRRTDITYSVLPRRDSTRSRRLARTESPTSSAPASTATAVATPASPPGSCASSK